MTCIVAVKHENRIYMGADSAGVGGYSLKVRADPKIYQVGNMLLGFTSSFRMGQLLGYRLQLPDHDPRIDVYKWMCTEFIDAIRNCFKNGGFATKDKEAEYAGVFLAAYKGRIFRIDCDYQVGEGADDFCAVGCGEDLALGALYASPHMNPTERVNLALQAAERFSAGVRGPFLIKELQS